MAEFEEGSFKLFGRTIQVAKERGGDHQGVRDTTSTADPPCRDGAPSLRRPERSLPCPRCRSLNTKFCYYNNYKANQPRHFCRSCQRYWTAGGAMRNVPVGSGRRKSKCSALRPPPANVGASTVLSFGSPREKARWTEEEAAMKNCTNACYYWVGPPQNLLGTSIEGTGSVEPAGSDPEVMRIDDPSEAARSSIWLTVGGGGSMKAFEAKKKEGGTSVMGNSNKNSLVASSNPAAFSRAINFQETT